MKQQIKRLAVSASAVALLAAFSQPAFAARCATGVSTTSTEVVKDIDVDTGSAITDVGLETSTVSVVDEVTQTKNPAVKADLGFLGTYTIIPAGLVVTNVGSSETPVLEDATLTTETGEFVTNVTASHVNVINSVTPRYSGASDAGSINSFACGQNSDVRGSIGATAIGPNASASEALLSSAFGSGAQADDSAFSTATGALANASDSFGSTATGASSDASDSVGSTATGAFSNASNSIGSTATGAGANVAYSIESTATGAGANAALSIGSTATGADASASLSIGSTATGAHSNAALSIGSTANGAFSDVSGTAFATASGFGSEVAAFTQGGTAYGAFSRTSGNAATAIGAGSEAGENATALGAGTSANANGSVAVGRDSSGNGAVASKENEFVLGTANHTYTAPGITSDLSRERQTGPLEVVTTDSNGHLASDGGQIFRELGEQGAGIAIATALENPDLVGNETFGLAANVGFFEGNSALAVAAMGVIGQNFMGGNERWAISGGVGVSLNENNYGGHQTDRTVAGRAGVQVSW
ncbi:MULTISPECIES: hypothetical protein [Rhodomicrobium]|uniref:hypothetical protein n=1 Tax=Rhodomicrobium TaxID=1068 RepID=UPI000B4BB57C|nr:MULTISPECIES: hypothetical protein [Rhodomicrobium]